MGTFYTITFTPEESMKWMCYEDNKVLAVMLDKQYDLYWETDENEGSEVMSGNLSEHEPDSKAAGLKKKYFIINDNGERVYDIWQKTRGDLVTLSPI
jgi:hypothetical protein